MGCTVRNYRNPWIPAVKGMQSCCEIPATLRTWPKPVHWMFLWDMEFLSSHPYILIKLYLSIQYCHWSRGGEAGLKAKLVYTEHFYILEHGTQCQYKTIGNDSWPWKDPLNVMVCSSHWTKKLNDTLKFSAEVTYLTACFLSPMKKPGIVIKTEWESRGKVRKMLSSNSLWCSKTNITRNLYSV